MFVMFVLPLIGCSDSDSQSASQNIAKDQAKADRAASSTTKNKSGTAATKNPETPDGAIRAVIAGFRENRTEVLWEFLPARYQADVNELIRQTVAGIDPKVWDAIVRSLKKLVGVLKAKKQFVIKNQNLMASLNIEQKTELWTQLIAFADLLLESDLSDHDKLKTLDVGKFLSTTGNSLLKEIRVMAESTPGQLPSLTTIEQMKVKLIRSDGETAIVQVDGPDDVSNENQLIRIDGKWVPKKFSEGWPKVIANVRNQIIGQVQIDDARKPQLMMTIEDIDGLLDQFAKVDSQQEFDQMLLSVVRRYMKIPVSDPTRNLKPQPVTVVVEAILNSEAEDELIAIIKAATDDPKHCDLEVIVEDQTTMFTVSPVSDIQAFAKKLTYGKITNVDAEELVIVIKPTRE